jgi:hypothetical protein
MSVGSSGRIVLEIDPEIKRELYAELEKDGITLKDWFLKNTETYLFENVQLRLKFEQTPSGERASA